LGRRNDDEFVEFAAARQAQLRRTAYLMCGDWQQAADIVQEALIRVYVAWPRLDRGAGLTAYARKAVVSAAIDMGRRRSSTEVPAPHDPTVAAATDVAGSVTDRQALLTALAQLPPRQRACVVLRYFEDLPVSDVARHLGVNEGTVKSQTSRGLSSLQQIFREQGHEELVVTRDGGVSA
jgi:RNA polymerase sigma-70 factor (sigma-E family)